ncbi:hypothetical protein ACIO1C_26705 [Streptomyces sp. NPDC087420]|uniref:hypothetical protein n=1 Tax=Streptomyces sp. NPDC087420 TaxID=3365785 RepID=UPI00383235A5
MTDKPTDAGTDEHGYGAGPWWTELGTVGAVGLIVLGGVAAAWVFLGLPGFEENPASGYYQAAKVLAVGTVLAGSALLSRRRNRDRATEGDVDEPERA